jgi:hypothetical protein
MLAAKGRLRGSGLCTCGGIATSRTRPWPWCLAGNERGHRFYERYGAYRIADRVAFQWEGNSIVELLYRFD